ncbi:SDR family NAD(P)-dependent oxidoreductase [Sorangium sp. So ce375]|uniref:type I polyketide synthase n=1 Tax=Sorangium sp. So ce375 TaxID=3133306 RepID=UPI003F5CAADB
MTQKPPSPKPDEATLSPLKRALLALERMQARVAELERGAQPAPIAIIGGACRFPAGATSLDAYWRMLRDGVDAIRDVPRDRWDPARYAHLLESPQELRWGGFLDNVDAFDAAFFNISPREAKHLDPQQRLLLEVAWEAFESATLAPDRLAGSRTGVFVGICTSDYLHMHLRRDPSEIDAYMGTGNALAVAAGRLSYYFGLRGPSLAVDTACSSSLIALHQAVQSLRRGETDLALAGGVNVILLPEIAITFSRARMLAADGRCKTFDARADGFVRSEGCGLVVLRRLDDALAAGDPILAVVRGTAANQDGRSNGLTAPNGPSQVDVLRAALADAGVPPASIDYVEAHGTGTRLGDPIEVQALLEVFGASRRPDRPLWLGSVKTNLGHLEAAAGIAGVLKTALALRHRALPPHLHLLELNPHLRDVAGRIAIPKTRCAWPGSGPELLAGVSAFGISGTNAHAILGSPPAEPEAAPSPARPRLFTLSARDPAALCELAARTAEALDPCSPEGFADACFTSQLGRAHLEHRAAIVAEAKAVVTAALRDLSTTGAHADLVQGETSSTEPLAPVFVFPGQGAQFPGMGRELFAAEPVFRSALERFGRLVDEHLDRPLLDVLFGSDAEALLGATANTQPALLAVELALAELWASWGVRPAAVLGHSVGAYAAACIAGILDPADALRLVAARGRLMQERCERGATAAALAGPDRVAAILREAGIEGVEIAAINGPDNVAVAGTSRAIQAASAALARAGVDVRLLPVSHAFHCRLVDPMLPPFAALCRELRHAAPAVPFVSDTTGEWQTALDGDAWVRHVRAPVRFGDGLRTLSAAGHRVFLEVGPGSSLSAIGRRTFDDAHTFVPSFRRSGDALSHAVRALATLYVRGASPRWEALHEPGRRRRSELLPHYPFQRQRHWMAPASTPRRIEGHPLLGPARGLADGQTCFEAEIDAERLPGVASDHVVFGAALVPGVALLEAMDSAARALLGAEAYAVEDVSIHKALLLPASGSRILQSLAAPLSPDRSSFRIFSRALVGQGTSPWTEHASATLARARAKAEPVDIDSLRRQAPTSVSGERFYTKLLRKIGGDGPRPGATHQRLTTLWVDRAEAAGRFDAATIPRPRDGAFGVAPLFLGLDACFQLVEAIRMHTPGCDDEALYLPVRVESMQVHGAGPPAWVHVRLDAAPRPTDELIRGDALALDEAGAPLAVLRGFWLKRATAEAVARLVAQEAPRVCSLRYVPVTPPPRADLEGSRWLVCGAGAALAGELCGALHARRASASVVAASSSLRDALAGEPAHGSAVVLWVLPDAPADDRTPHVRAEQLCADLLPAIQALAVAEGAYRFWLVVPAGDAASAAAAGLARTLAWEHPRAWGGVVEVDTRTPASLGLLVDALAAEVPEDHLSVDSAGLQAARMIDLTQASKASASPSPPLGASPGPRPTAWRASPDATYIVAGGLGALGGAVARRLADRGARHIVLVGRDARSADEAIAELGRRGASARFVAADLADRAALRAALEPVLGASPPARGFVHAAGALDDGVLVNLTPERLTSVMRAKAAGAANVHALIGHQPLDFLVFFSSATAVFGAPGQGNYGAANAFLDAFARQIAASGGAARSVAWGPWASAGMAARRASTGALSIRGLAPLDPEVALDTLESILAGNEPSCVVLPPDLAPLSAAHPLAPRASLLRGLVAPPLAAPPPPRGGADPGRPARPREALLALVAAVLGGGDMPLDPARPLAAHGMDSLMAVELRDRIAQTFGVRVTLVELLAEITLDALVERVQALLHETAAGEDELEEITV